MTRRSPTASRARLALELRRGRHALLSIAIVAVLSAGLGAVVLTQLDVRWPWSSGLTFDVEVTSASGVDPGSTTVTVAGVKAGHVTGVRRSADGVILHVELDRKFGPIRQDAVARLRPRTPLQDMVLDITDRGHGGALPSGGRISATQTHTAVPVSEVLDTFALPTRRRLQTLLQQLGTAADDRGAQLQAAFVTLVPFLRASTRITDEVADRAAMTRHLVHNSGLLFDELARRDRALAGLVHDGGATLKAIGDERAALAQTIDELAPTLSTLRSASTHLTGALARTEPALHALQQPADRLPGALDALDRLGQEARPALDALDPALVALRPAARRLPAVARGLRDTATQLTPQAPQLTKVVRDVDVCRYPLNKFFQNTLSFYKYGSPYGPVGRSELVYGTASFMGSASPSEELGPMCYDQTGAGR